MTDALSFPFVQRALLAVLLAAPLLGGLSHLVVARRLAFFSAAIGQAVLTGVALGVLLGEPVDAPWGSVFGFSLLTGVVLVFVRRRSLLPPDTLVGVLLAFTLGLGVCLLVAVTKRFNIHQLEAVMFGSVLTVRAGDLAALGAALVVTVGLVGPMANRLLVQAVDARLAAAARMPEARDEYLFVVVLTAAIVVSVKVMGALMVEAMLVVPAAAARNVSASARAAFAWSVAVALVAGVAGLFVSTQVNVPSGAAIVLGLALAFVVSLLPRPFRR
ncbi:MAG: metal ABC transporter permease [Myxococcota bacterium]